MQAAATYGQGDPAPAFDLTPLFLEQNVEALGLSGRTLELVRSARAPAPVHILSDATPVVRCARGVVGMALDDREVDAVAARAEADGSVLVVFGLGLGHTVRRLRSRTARPIVVYEPDPTILRSHLEFGPSDLGGVPIVCALPDLERVWPSVAVAGTGAQVVGTPGYMEAFPAAQGELRSALTDVVQRMGTNGVARRVRGRSWVKDVCENVELLLRYPTFAGLKNAYEGVPAFIVGAGPSLDKNIGALGDAVKKGIVIATNSSASALAKRGIEPQVLACIESIDVSRFLRDLPFVDRVLRAFSLSASPQALRTGAGPLLPIYEALPAIGEPLRQLVGEPGLPVCASVSTAAVALALRMGCNPIVLVGHDLAFTGGAAYARGTPYEGSRAHVTDDGNLRLSWTPSMIEVHRDAGSKVGERETLRELPAWGGLGTVASGMVFAGTRAWFAEGARSLKQARPHLRFINATEGGAHIPDWEELRLEAVLGQLPDTGLTSADLAARAAQTPPLSADALIRWGKTQLGLVEQARRAAERLRRMALAGQRAVQSGRAGQLRKVYEQLAKREVELKEAVARSPMVDAWAHADVTREMNHGKSEGDARSDALLAMRQEIAVAAAVERAAKELQEELTAMIERIRSRSSV
jgi:hypothetical protein